MVHDEEAEISIRLATLIVNSQRNRSAAGQFPVDLPDGSANELGGVAADDVNAPKSHATQGVQLCH